MNMADYVLDTISSTAYEEGRNEGRNEVMDEVMDEANNTLNAFPTLTNHEGQTGQQSKQSTPRRSSFEMQNNSGRSMASMASMSSMSSTFSASVVSSANGAYTPVSWHACCCQKRYTPWELQHGENDGFCHGYVYPGSVPPRLI